MKLNLNYKIYNFNIKIIHYLLYNKLNINNKQEILKIHKIYINKHYKFLIKNQISQIKINL